MDKKNGSSSYRKKQKNISPGRTHLEAMKNLDGLIRTLKDQVMVENDMLTSKVVHYKGMPVQLSESKDKIGETVPGIVDTKEQIEKYIQTLQKKKSVTYILLQKMDVEYQKLIILYFIQNKTLEQTAEEMKKSYKWTWTKIHQSLKEFENLYEEWKEKYE